MIHSLELADFDGATNIVWWFDGTDRGVGLTADDLAKVFPQYPRWEIDAMFGSLAELVARAAEGTA